MDIIFPTTDRMIPRPVLVMNARMVRLLRAGEVVGNPASAVKELVENSLDAGATRISIFLDNGGARSIVVDDDGWGMTEGDLALCLLPHASSKVSEETDLDTPHWLGFRGEALAALSTSCASVEVRSRRDGDHGWSVRSTDGSIGEVMPASCIPGTRVEVLGMHAHAPARLAMFKGAAREAALVRKMLEHVSLGAPSVSFRLQSGKNVLLCLSAVSTVQERISELRDETGIDVDVEDEGWMVQGRIFPGTSRMENRWLMGGRAVQRDTALSLALRSAGRGLAGGGGTPSFWGTVQPPQGYVLHNVHAAKEEVRHRVPEKAAATLGRIFLSAARPARGNGHTHPWQGDGLLPVTLEGGTGILGDVLGIAHGGYVISLSDGGLVLVDAHAAHERILLEALRGPVQSMSLPQPSVVQLDTQEWDILESGRDALLDMGFGLLDMDSGAIAVIAVPEVLGSWMPSEAFKAALVALPYGRSAVEERLADLACRSAWRNGDGLDCQTATRLLRTMEVTPSSSVCNHGRPTCVRLPQEAMARLFGR